MAFNNVVPGNTWNYPYSDYTPYLLDIIGITNAGTATINFGTTHPYTPGEILSFRVSEPYGMTEINNLSGRVISITSTTVTVEINTTNFTAFVYPPVGVVEVPAQAVPAGSGVVPSAANPAIPATIPQTNLQDAFDNKDLFY